MNLKEIKEIINLMNENDLSEIEIDREGSKIKIRKGPYGSPAVISSVPAAPVMAPEIRSAGGEPVKSTATGLKEIKAPMVGTFYRSPSPDAPSFVEIGQFIEVGQAVCILEAMKLMNEIKSDVRGKIIDIKIQNAEPVEFGTVLFLIEPA